MFLQAQLVLLKRLDKQNCVGQSKPCWLFVFWSRPIRDDERYWKNTRCELKTWHADRTEIQPKMWGYRRASRTLAFSLSNRSMKWANEVDMLRLFLFFKIFLCDCKSHIYSTRSVTDINFSRTRYQTLRAIVCISSASTWRNFVSGAVRARDILHTCALFSPATFEQEAGFYLQKRATSLRFVQL